MPRRVKKQPSLLAPAGNLLKKISDTDIRLRRKVVRYGLWAIAVLFVYSLMSGTYGLPRIVRLEMEKKSLIQANQELRGELIDAERIRTLLLTDPDYIEYVARTRYHMVYPNETIYRYRGQ